MLINAIKELTQEIKELMQENETLKARLEKIEKALGLED